MATGFSFHPEALFEYAEATKYYLDEASPRVAEAFVAAIEFAVAGLVADPARWRIIDVSEIRRYVFTRFPFVIYYQWEQEHEHIVIYAVMHTSRKPNYWHHRIQRE